MKQQRRTIRVPVTQYVDQEIVEQVPSYEYKTNYVSVPQTVMESQVVTNYQSQVTQEPVTVQVPMTQTQLIAQHVNKVVEYQRVPINSYVVAGAYQAVGQPFISAQSSYTGYSAAGAAYPAYSGYASQAGSTVPAYSGAGGSGAGVYQGFAGYTVGAGAGFASPAGFAGGYASPTSGYAGGYSTIGVGYAAGYRDPGNSSPPVGGYPAPSGGYAAPAGPAGPAGPTGYPGYAAAAAGYRQY